MSGNTVETHGAKQPTWPVGPVAFRLALFVIMAGLVAALYLWQASEIARLGQRIETLQERTRALERENAELLDQIAVEGSIPRLQERAAKAGFVPATQVEYLQVTAVPPDTAPALRDLWAASK